MTEENILLDLLSKLIYPVVIIITATLGMLWKAINANKAEMRQNKREIDKRLNNHDKSLATLQTLSEMQEGTNVKTNKELEKLERKIDELPDKLANLIKALLKG